MTCVLFDCFECGWTGTETAGAFPRRCPACGSDQIITEFDEETDHWPDNGHNEEGGSND